MNSKFTKWVAGAVVALSLFSAVGVAQASSLTSTQISAIIGLLQSFGADAGTINSVSLALGGSTTSTTLSCSSFAGISYGSFDNNPGGPVSQLQTWLGIPSTTFGFGTYGPKTLAAWNAKCGTQTDKTAQQDTRQYGVIEFSATPTLGVAPLQVQFTRNNWDDVANPVVDFGDGTSGPALSFAIAASQNEDTLGHTYTSTGTYTAKFEDSSGNVLATQTITVTGSNSTNLTATPTSGSAPLTVTFSGGGSGGGNPNDGPFISFGNGSAQVQMGCSATASGGGCAYPYSINHTYSSTGTYQAQIYSQATGNVIGTATVTVTGSNSNQPSVSLTASPTSGTTPLQVEFFTSSPGWVNFGDGSPTSAAFDGNCGPTYHVCNAFHTYTSPGTYTTTVKDSSGNSLGTATITVTGSN